MKDLRAETAALEEAVADRALENHPQGLGSTIVDLAAVAGGNCELTEPGESVERHGVVIHGATNLPAQVPVHASQMYSKNLQALLNHLISEEGVQIDLDDEITGAICVTHAGEVRFNS